MNSPNPFTKSKAKKDYEVAVQKQAAYREKHAGAIGQYEAAEKYLKDHLNGYGKIPEKEWRAELAESLTGGTAQVEKYYALRDDVRSAETLLRGAEQHMRDITPERTAQKSRDMAL